MGGVYEEVVNGGADSEEEDGQEDGQSNPSARIRLLIYVIKGRDLTNN